MNAAADELVETELLPSLVSIAKVMRALMALQLGPLGYHIGQDELLFALHADEPLTVSAIATKLIVRPSTVSKMSDRLGEKGLIVRSAHPADARLTLIALTPAGVQARRMLKEVRREFEREIMKALAGDDMAAIQRGVRRVEEMLIRRLARIR